MCPLNLYDYMNKFILTISLLVFSNAFCQIDNAIVEYKKVRLKKVFKESKKEALANFEKGAKIEEFVNKSLKEAVFSLSYKGGESFFQVRNTMEISKSRAFKMSLGPDGSSKYYNSKNEILREINIFGEDFLISKAQYKWDLKTETKTIGGYNCYKAVLVEKMKTRKGSKNVLVEAWYTPEINIPFGPIGYSGLPGLILELKRNNIKYYAENIKLNPEDKFTIKKLTRGKKVSEEEFYDIAIKTVKDFRKNRGY